MLQCTVYFFVFCVSCRAQIVSFLASCLATPEMFDQKSENSINDLILFIQQDDIANVNYTLLKDLVEELDKQNYLSMVCGVRIHCVVIVVFTVW
jgi:hypothetical protein